MGRADCELLGDKVAHSAVRGRGRVQGVVLGVPRVRLRCSHACARRQAQAGAQRQDAPFDRQRSQAPPSQHWRMSRRDQGLTMRDDYFCEQSLRLGILPLERRTAKVLYIHLLLLINGMHGPMPGRSAMQTGRYQWVSVATISLQSVEDSEIPTYQL